MQISPAERKAFIDALTTVGRKLRTAFDARLRTQELTLARGRILMILSRRDNVTLTDLAQELEVETPTAVRLLDGLERAQLLERLPVPEDRRVKRLALTKGGVKLAAQVNDMAAAMREEVLAGVTAEELATAQRVFEAMARNIAEFGNPQTPAALRA